MTIATQFRSYILVRADERPWGVLKHLPRRHHESLADADEYHKTLDQAWDYTVHQVTIKDKPAWEYKATIADDE